MAAAGTGQGHGIGQDRSKGRGRGRPGRGRVTTSQGRSGQGSAGQGRAGVWAGQGMNAQDNAKGNSLDNTGHGALYDKAKGVIDCGTGQRAWQSGRQDGERGRILW